MPGPAASKNVRRRNARPDWRSLPPKGYVGRVPDWPLDLDEPKLWAELWRTPQAEAWSELGWTRGVARYAMLLVEQEGGKANAALLAEIRQMEDRLGLSPMAMKRLQWEVVEGMKEPAVSDGNVVNLFG
jgi:hypothetical protein